MRQRATVSERSSNWWNQPDCHESGMPSMTNLKEHQEQHHEGPELNARAFVITASDTRTDETDASGQRIEQMLTEQGHMVLGRELCKEDPEQMSKCLDRALRNPECDLVIVNGGTGISRRDGSFEMVEHRLHKVLPGFGELFRQFSVEQVGAFAMMSRATGGLSDAGPLLFSLPGSTKAVTLAMEKLILPTLRHMLKEIRK